MLTIIHQHTGACLYFSVFTVFFLLLSQNQREKKKEEKKKDKESDKVERQSTKVKMGNSCQPHRMDIFFVYSRVGCAALVSAVASVVHF